ncbi:MAG: DegV family protein [Acholeplasmatales bacterium]|nr:DegV family protein [Acholeplasmatales bacterium]
MSIKIIADSSSDVLEINNINVKNVPLKIVTKDKEFIDDDSLDIKEMVNYLDNYKGKSGTSCPSTGEWLESFQDYKEIICITITGTLSGSYNSACLAKKIYEENYPDRKVFVYNTLSAGPEIMLIIEKASELISQGKTYDEVCESITKYSEKTGLLFMLESMKNLANNGRVKPLLAKMAGLFGIRVIGKASDKGDLEEIAKCRGEKKSLEALVKILKKEGYKGGKLRIAHVFNEEVSKKLQDLIKNAFQNAQIAINRCRGLCSFYAEKGGLLIGFEK